MGAITVEQLVRSPSRLIEAVENGEVAVVTKEGRPLFLAVPVDEHLDAQKVRLEIAISLFDREQISIGVASRIAGLSISEMINELGTRQIPVARYSEEEFAQEMKYVRGLTGRR